MIGTHQRGPRIPRMDRNDYRRASLENWQTMAPGWGRRRAEVDEITAPVREWLVRELGATARRDGPRARGRAGDSGFSVAALLGDEGRLITSDFSPAMVEIARRRAAELGLENVEFRVLDALELELEDDAVDGVICRFGYMLMADPTAALAETRRVLRAGGRLVFAVWRGPEQNPWVSIAGRALVERGLMPPPEPGAPSMFALASDERVHALLGEAGFANVQIEDVPVRFDYLDVEEYVTVSSEMGGAFATAFGGASEDAQEAVVEELRTAFAPFATDDGIELPGVALVAVAG